MRRQVPRICEAGTYRFDIDSFLLMSAFHMDIQDGNTVQISSNLTNCMESSFQNMNNYSILVAIRCITYNHEPYIRDCLEGFVMQKTNFKFVAIVHDDASTDKTTEIIREYEAKYPPQKK